MRPFVITQYYIVIRPAMQGESLMPWSMDLDLASAHAVKKVSIVFSGFDFV